MVDRRIDAAPDAGGESRFALRLLKSTPRSPTRESVFAPQLRTARDGPSAYSQPENNMSTLGLILLIIVVLMLLGAVPAWPHSRSWGYMPSGTLGVVLIVVVVLLLLGHI